MREWFLETSKNDKKIFITFCSFLFYSILVRFYDVGELCTFYGILGSHYIASFTSKTTFITSYYVSSFTLKTTFITFFSKTNPIFFCVRKWFSILFKITKEKKCKIMNLWNRMLNFPQRLKTSYNLRKVADVN